MKTIVNTENVKYSVTCKNDNESILNVDIFMAAEFIKLKIGGYIPQIMHDLYMYSLSRVKKREKYGCIIEIKYKS